MRSRSLCYGAIAVMLGAGAALAQQQQQQQQQQRPPAQAEPPSRVTAPDHTIPPTGAAQPQAPLADQAKPAAVGPTQAAATGQTTAQEVPGATRQTMPSTISAENAAQDKLPTAAFQFPLTAEQKKLIADAIAKNPAGKPAGPSLGNAKLYQEIPNTTEMQAFPSEVTAQIPGAANYKYVMAGDRVLIVDPPAHTVVGEISK